MEDRLEALERRVRQLEDIEAIRVLRMQYHDFINERRFDRMPELFTPDARVDFGPVAKGRGTDEIREMFAKLARSADLVKQFIHNHMVDVTGDSATGIAYLDARYAQKGESVIVAAKFFEKYRRTAEGWRISEMVAELYFAVPITKGWAGTELNFIPPWK